MVRQLLPWPIILIWEKERLEEKLKNVYEEISFKKSVVHKGIYPAGPEVYGKALCVFLLRVREVSRCRECRWVPGGLAEPWACLRFVPCGRQACSLSGVIDVGQWGGWPPEKLSLPPSKDMWLSGETSVGYWYLSALPPVECCSSTGERYVLWTGSLSCIPPASSPHLFEVGPLSGQESHTTLSPYESCFWSCRYFLYWFFI